MKKFITLLLGLFVLSACSAPGQYISGGERSGIKPAENVELQKFSSVEEIVEFLESNEYSGNAYNTFSTRSLSENMVFADAVMDSAGSTAPQTTKSASDYSTTNIQVQNVDEADFVKNDGKYIYFLNDNQVSIVDAYPAETAEVISEINFEGHGESLFLSENKLIVFASFYDQERMFSEYEIMPSQRSVQYTKILVYDIADKNNPFIQEQFSIKGGFFQARMLDGFVYLITKDSVYRYNDFVDMPSVKSSNGIFVPEVYYLPNPEKSYSFHTITSLDIESLDFEASSYLMGHSNNLYMSENNLYISYNKNYPWRYYEEENKERFFEVVVPLLPSDYSSKIQKFRNDDSDFVWMKISDILADMFEEYGEDNLEKTYKKIQESLAEYDAKKAEEKQRTIIQKLSVKNGVVKYESTAELKGYLNNQFSLDENEGYLRVATTLDVWSNSGRITNNQVYVLDEEMDLVGKLENVAPGETIYSTRFIDDRLYMVTFERIDPFFVIDLSNPKKPEILGELKIPGFSDYLHPYDENHIIGIGKQTEENEYGNLITKGVKLSLFDVSNVESPKQIDYYEIGGRGTYSEALSEHKAFLFDKEKNILVIPIREVDYDNPLTSDSLYYTRYEVWQGAYAFGLTIEDGFELKGKVSHESIFDRDYYWYGSPSAVRRSIFMDDVLYTISQKKIMMNDLEDLSEINEIDFEDFIYENNFIRGVEPPILILE